MKSHISTIAGIIILTVGVYLVTQLPSSEQVNLGADLITIEGNLTSKGMEYQYARLDKNNIVIEVIAMTQDELDSGKYGSSKSLVLASHETLGQKNLQFAGIGYSYDRTTGVFTPPKTKETEIFDSAKWEWVDTQATST